MADLQKILNKFNQLGIVNEGLSVDAPAVKKKQDFEFEKPQIESTDEFVGCASSRAIKGWRSRPSKPGKQRRLRVC